MQTPAHPTGTHCCTFDMELLRQAVVTEVDIAVRRLCCERGIRPDSVDQHLWVDAILHRVGNGLRNRHNMHTLLSDEIDDEIAAEISHLIDCEIQKHRPADAGSFLMPVHGLWRLPQHAGVLWRKIFEKHIE